MSPRMRDGDFIYALSAVENRPALTAPRHASTALFFCRENAVAAGEDKGIFTATPTERITHYTLLRKVVCQMEALPPLETPTRKGGMRPVEGVAYRLFLLSSPPAVSVEQKSAWD